MSNATTGMWGGRFGASTDEGDAALFRAVNDSLPVDWRLVQQDIAASVAWANALVGAGVLTQHEADALHEALRDLSAEAAALDHPPIESGAEDVHTWVEQMLVSKLGDLGKKLHTGRSRNDQVATDLRLWAKQAIDERLTEIAQLRTALVECAEHHEGVPFPSFTHLQTAQPILFAHWCLAYAEMLDRDSRRLRDARARVDELPLGCAALAGTAYPIDRESIAKDLGFQNVSHNSIDAVSDRDFVIETIGALALVSAHLSRFAEDLIVYTSGPFAMIELSDDVSSGSSIMPQKKNPDACELIRAKASVIAGYHATMLGVIKGLPTAYNKDLQEDKRSLFSAMDETSMCVRLAAACARGLRVDSDRAAELSMASCSNATELADYLVGLGVPFRDAHEQVGKLVRIAIERGVGLEDLPLDTIRAESPTATETVYDALALEGALARRASIGGTAPERIEQEIKRHKRLIAEERRHGA